MLPSHFFLATYSLPYFHRTIHKKQLALLVIVGRVSKDIHQVHEMPLKVQVKVEASFDQLCYSEPTGLSGPKSSCDYPSQGDRILSATGLAKLISLLHSKLSKTLVIRHLLWQLSIAASNRKKTNRHISSADRVGRSVGRWTGQPISVNSNDLLTGHVSTVYMLHRLRCFAFVKTSIVTLCIISLSALHWQLNKYYL